MDYSNKSHDGSGLLKILLFIIFILVVVYLVIGTNMIFSNNKECEKTLDSLNISYADESTKWFKCTKIKVENFDVDVREYSFDDGDTWQTSNIFSACEQGTLSIKIRDEKKKILGSDTFTIKFDETAPELDIPGDTTINKDEEIDLMEGVTATDSESGIYGNIKVTPEKIDTSKVGEYKITYTVKDRALNEVSKERIITVK